MIDPIEGMDFGVVDDNNINNNLKWCPSMIIHGVGYDHRCTYINDHRFTSSHAVIEFCLHRVKVMLELTLASVVKPVCHMGDYFIKCRLNYRQSKMPRFTENTPESL